MSKKTKTIILLFLFALVLAGAAFAYQRLSRSYAGIPLFPQNETTQDTAEGTDIEGQDAAAPSVTPIPVPDSTCPMPPVKNFPFPASRENLPRSSTSGLPGALTARMKCPISRRLMTPIRIS